MDTKKFQTHRDSQGELSCIFWAKTWICSHCSSCQTQWLGEIMGSWNGLGALKSIQSHPAMAGTLGIPSAGLLLQLLMGHEMPSESFLLLPSYSPFQQPCRSWHRGLMQTVCLHMVWQEWESVGNSEHTAFQSSFLHTQPSEQFSTSPASHSEAAL